MSPASVVIGRLAESLVECRDRRPASRVGRHARLELVFACRNGRTVLAEAYAEPPLRVGRCFREGEGLHVILASSAPGVFGGDCFEQSIRVERGAGVRLTSQSALQVHPGADGSVARLLSNYHMDHGAQLQCEWKPLIPFAGARIEQQVSIDLADSAYLYWSDALMSGRQARGEQWKFATLAHELAVSRAGSLEYLERYRVAPNEEGVCRSWVAGDASYLGTTLMSGREIDVDTAERLHADLGAVAGVRAAVDELDRRLLLVRLMAASGPRFHEARLRVGRALALALNLQSEGT
jgi:urease accessory protein UreH